MVYHLAVEVALAEPALRLDETQVDVDAEQQKARLLVAGELPEILRKWDALGFDQEVSRFLTKPWLGDYSLSGLLNRSGTPTPLGAQVFTTANGPG